MAISLERVQSQSGPKEKRKSETIEEIYRQIYKLLEEWKSCHYKSTIDKYYRVYKKLDSWQLKEDVKEQLKHIRKKLKWAVNRQVEDLIEISR